MNKRLKGFQRRSSQLKRWIICVTLGTIMTVVGANACTAFSIGWSLIEDIPGTILNSVPSVIPSSVAEATGQPALEYPMAMALLHGTAVDSPISGRILFVQTPEGLNLSGSLINASPGYHGFHIHEMGSCAEQGMASGGHFNPNQVKHGHLIQDGLQQAHAGDLGNVAVDTNGIALLDQTFPDLRLHNGDYAVAGRAVILHENLDDMSQPNGNAGARIACGVIVPLS